MKTFDTWMNEAYSSVEKKQHAATRYGDNFKLPPLVPGEKVGPPATATREFVRTPDPERNPAETMPKGASKDAKSVNNNPISKILQNLNPMKYQRIHQSKRDVKSSVNTFIRGQSKYQFGNETGRSRIYPTPKETNYKRPGSAPGVI